MSADHSDENTDEPIDDQDPVWVAPEGHTALLDQSIIDAAATPIAWDHDLPADGIVEHGSPGEFVNSMQYGPAVDDDDQGAAAAAEAAAKPPAKKAAPAKKAPAKKAPAKKAPAKAAGAKAAK